MSHFCSYPSRYASGVNRQEQNTKYLWNAHAIKVTYNIAHRVRMFLFYTIDLTSDLLAGNDGVTVVRVKE